MVDYTKFVSFVELLMRILFIYCYMFCLFVFFSNNSCLIDIFDIPTCIYCSAYYSKVYWMLNQKRMISS